MRQGAGFATAPGAPKEGEGKPSPVPSPEERRKEKAEGIVGETTDGEKLREGFDNVQFTWRTSLYTCGLVGVFLLYHEYIKHRQDADARALVQHERIGTPKLGGPFDLVNRKGGRTTDEDLKGQYLLIYFGFVMCPDICPQEMEKQTNTIELLDAEFGPVATPVFISVDPKRDTPEEVDKYLQEFHPRAVGLTGTAEEIKQVSRSYRVYYNEGTKNSEKDYLIDHSIIHYFMGKDGLFVDFFGKNMTAREMADKMKVKIAADQEKARKRKERRGVESVDES